MVIATIPAEALLASVGPGRQAVRPGLAAEGRVYAFEPGSYARSILRMVVWLHGLANVAVLAMALGGVSGIENLSLPIKNRGAAGFGLAHLGAPEDRWRSVAQELVSLTTLDTVVSALGLERVDFIKADVEGWELRLLSGGEATLRRFRPRLLIELASRHLARAGDRLDDAFAFLGELGYVAFELDSGGRLVPGLLPHDGDFWFIPTDDAMLEIRWNDCKRMSESVTFPNPVRSQ